ncbi:hypothetical protein AAA406_02540 [Lactobacillus crispatus]|uniref:hypothetical protein n=1 Tax=Lactobacillus crispatus TaxID=47770 RepID=UPI0030F8F31E
MNDKEKKLTEALKEYFGRDVGDVEGEPNFMDYSTKLPGLVHPIKRIVITTVPYKPTFEERRKELVDQLDKDLKEIDGDFNVKIKGDRIYIYLCAVRLYELYGEDNMAIYSVYLKVEKIAKAMEAISGFSWNLRQLKEQ